MLFFWHELLYFFFQFGISDLGFDFGIKACYTFNGSCTERCPQASTRQIDTLPDPVIIHYIPNQRECL